ncbi:hypothetical protein [Salinibius halmophilus]|uniref:hypothetical protein n=1 Tax=Salinibius halmophilus TaxID=1853216 RepID=UPI000E664690|nr:hypothetical protein [Salinibius halmophilus]
MNKLTLAIASTALATAATAQISNIEMSERSARTIALTFDAPAENSVCTVRLGHANAPSNVYNEVKAWSEEASKNQQVFLSVPSPLWAEPKSVEVACTSPTGMQTAQTWVPAPPSIAFNLNGSHDGETVTIKGGIMVQGNGAESYCWEKDFPVLIGKSIFAESFENQDTFWDTYYTVDTQISDLYHSYAGTNIACSGKGGVSEAIVELRMNPNGEVEFITYPTTYR